MSPTQRKCRSDKGNGEESDSRATALMMSPARRTPPSMYTSKPFLSKSRFRSSAIVSTRISIPERAKSCVRDGQRHALKGATTTHKLTTTVIGEDDTCESVLGGKDSVLPALNSLEYDGHPVRDHVSGKSRRKDARLTW